MNSPEYCPECSLQDIYMYDHEFSLDAFYAYFTCQDCGCKWVETYKFMEVEILARE